MIQSLVSSLGPWNWWLLGLVLLAAELAAPGMFLIWIGVAAIIIGAASLALWDQALWTWQNQLILFAALSVVVTLIGRRVFAAREGATDEPLLNRRGDSLVGRTASLAEPIRNGRGRIKLDDTWWSVSGPDLPSGMKVRVAAWNGRELVVEPVA
ncbi:NfeD family protein [Rhizobium oryzicola]|uniref:NfeD family protein n=1 Tax=Rhizobium oryzicola TaxID=1232668 RepID=A0ABT8SU70_9HYPH|nr:NfeD family protein [Rhizobium oryzicola]MDO1581980.1 NfeD family protein [Rhizobium oryzicola]